MFVFNQTVNNITMETSENPDNTIPTPKMTLKSKIRFALYLTLGFALMVPAGAFITEKVKEVVAHGLGYKAHYRPGLGRSMYYSPMMGKAYNDIEELYAHDAEKYKVTPEWKALMDKHNWDLATIQLSGRIFSLLVSAVGLFIYFSRRRKGRSVLAVDWICILLGLFFMRDVVIDSASFYFKFTLCDENAIWTLLGWPVWTTLGVLIALGLILFLFILYKIPKRYLLLFLLSGFIGTCAGTYIWLKGMSLGTEACNIERTKTID